MKNKKKLSEIERLFLKSAKDGDEQLLKDLLPLIKAQGNVETIVDSKWGGNALHWAAIRGLDESVKILVSEFPELLNSKSKNGSTALLNAAFENHINTVRVLLELRADIKIINQNGESFLKLINSDKASATLKVFADEYLSRLHTMGLYRIFSRSINTPPLASGDSALDEHEPMDDTSTLAGYSVIP